MLALSKRQLGGFALGDVDDCREDHGSLVSLDRVQPDLDGELGPILLHAAEIAAGPHRAWMGISKKSRAHPWVMTKKPLRDEHFYGVTQELAS